MNKTVIDVLERELVRMSDELRYNRAQCVRHADDVLRASKNFRMSRLEVERCEMEIGAITAELHRMLNVESDT